jgi:hypothetical protein
MSDHPEPEVSDDVEHHRLVVEQEGAVAELVYQAEGDRLILVHTGVPDALGGRGIGGVLVRAAVDRADRDGATVVPWCPFARKWLQTHPEIAGTIDIDWASSPTD